jgi:hypothetical protein
MTSSFINADTWWRHQQAKRKAEAAARRSAEWAQAVDNPPMQNALKKKWAEERAADKAHAKRTWADRNALYKAAFAQAVAKAFDAGVTPASNILTHNPPNGGPTAT